MNSNYAIALTKHHLNDAIVIRRERFNNSLVGCALENTLKTSIDTTLIPSLGAASKEVPHSRKNVGSRVKRNIKCNLLSHNKKPPTVGWRLNDKAFFELHSIYKFLVEGCCNSLGLNGHKVLPFYSEHNSVLDHNVSEQSVN